MPLPARIKFIPVAVFHHGEGTSQPHCLNVCLRLEAAPHLWRSYTLTLNSAGQVESSVAATCDALPPHIQERADRRMTDMLAKGGKLAWSHHGISESVSLHELLQSWKAGRAGVLRPSGNSGLTLVPGNALQEAQRASGVQSLEIDWSDITRLQEAANGGPDDVVRFGQRARQQMQALMSRFGFPRMPVTWAELGAMVDHCNELHAAKGVGFKGELASGWQAATRSVWQKHRVFALPALDAWLAGDGDALRKAHSEAFIRELVAQYDDFERDDGLDDSGTR